MNIARLFKWWGILLVATLLSVAICIRWLDIPIALFFLGSANRFNGLERSFGAFPLVAGEMMLIASLAIARLVRGILPEFAKALLVASCASLSAFAANDYVLKVIFGRQIPSVFFRAPATHIFHFFQGTPKSGFPSGHMVMATAFAAALARIYPRASPFLIVLLCIGGTALILGDSHFLSDVIAGLFVGGIAGFVAGELWCQHVRHP
jgi:membrane-associated phospholipid phosphatase